MLLGLEALVAHLHPPTGPTSWIQICLFNKIFNIDHLKSLYWLCYSIASVLFCFFGLETCGIVAPRPGVEPAPPCIGRWSFNHWIVREIPQIFLFWGSSPYDSWVCENFRVTNMWIKVIEGSRWLFPSPSSALEGVYVWEQLHVSA